MYRQTVNRFFVIFALLLLFSSISKGKKVKKKNTITKEKEQQRLERKEETKHKNNTGSRIRPQHSVLTTRRSWLATKEVVEVRGDF